MSGKQLLLHGEADPGSGLPHVCLDLADVLDVSADERRDYRGWDHLLLYFNHVKIKGFFGDGNESN